MSPPSSPADSTTRPPAQGGYAAVARRIGGWTANLLATAIVLVASLAIGRQIVVWWHEGPPDATESAAAQGDLPVAAPQELRWWTARGPLTVEQVQGDEAAVLAAMCRRCREEPAGIVPLGQPGNNPAGPGEERYVARLANERPVEQTESLDLYQPSGGLAQVVAVARQRRRIAAWSFALPVGPSSWSCYTIHAAGAALPAAGATP
jgi:hypothetical protein